MEFNVDGLKLLADTVELAELQPTSSSSEPERMTRVRRTSSSCEQERVTELQPTPSSCEQERMTELQTTASSKAGRMECCGPSQMRVTPRWNSESLDETAETRLDDEIVNEVPIDDELEEGETAETRLEDEIMNEVPTDEELEEERPYIPPTHNYRSRDFPSTSQQASEGYPGATHADKDSYSEPKSDEEDYPSTLEETSQLPLCLTKKRFENVPDMGKVPAARDLLQEIQANVQASDRGMHGPGMQTVTATRDPLQEIQAVPVQASDRGIMLVLGMQPVTATRDPLQEIQAPAQASHRESLPFCYENYANTDDQIAALREFIRNPKESPSPEGSPSGNI